MRALLLLIVSCASRALSPLIEGAHVYVPKLSGIVSSRMPAILLPVSRPKEWQDWPSEWFADDCTGDACAVADEPETSEACVVDGDRIDCAELWLDDVTVPYAFNYAPVDLDEKEDMWCDSLNPSKRCLDESRLWELEEAPSPTRRIRMRERLRDAPPPARAESRQDHDITRIAEL